MNDVYLVTGGAGFIGYHLITKLLNENKSVIAIDNMNDYYDVKLKYKRVDILKRYPNFTFKNIDLCQTEELEELFKSQLPKYVINLAAQAGVRYSIDNPSVYIDSNIIGFYNLLEACRNHKPEHLVFASSSSVYGNNHKVPFSESDNTDSPVSLYAATKKSNELMAYTYSDLYDIPVTGLRFFTVYGPFGRPDMAYFNFTNMFFNNETLKIFNNGDFDNDLYRDFTFVDDVIEGIIKLLDLPPKERTKYRILNIGNSNPSKLMDFITTLEDCLTKSVGRNVVFRKSFEPIKPGDVKKTYADTKSLEQLVNYKPSTSLQDGLQKFTDWYVDYYKKS